MHDSNIREWVRRWSAQDLSLRPWQSLDYKPHAHCQFEKKDGTAVNPDGDNPEQLWKNDERECARSHQKGREHSPARQRSRNEPGLEPQIAKGGTAESGEYQADVIRIPVRADRQPGQRLQSIRFECLHVLNAAEDSQNVEV